MTQVSQILGGRERKMKAVYARFLLTIVVLPSLLLVPAAYAADQTNEMEADLFLIGNPNIKGTFEARAIGDPNALTGTGVFITITINPREVPTFPPGNVMFTFTGHIIGDPHIRAEITYTGTVMHSTDPGLLRAPVTINAFVEPDTKQIFLTIGTIGTFEGTGLIIINDIGNPNI